MDATQQNLDSIVKNNLIELAFDVQNVVFGYRKNLKIINKISVQIPEGLFISKIKIF
jgi:ABC-type transport system involved in Fe-S cluster assembly fused permease/ATPase subunit